MSELINAMMAASAGLSEEGVDHRARSISINAIREMRVAIGRDAGPWTDADGRLQNAIYLVLKRMDKVKVGESDDGSFPLVSPNQSTPSQTIAAVEKALTSVEKLDDEDGLPAIIAKIPKAAK
jgi:hypothetical protein